MSHNRSPRVSRAIGIGFLAPIACLVAVGRTLADSTTPRTIVYINKNDTTPWARTWNGTSWSAAASLASIDKKARWAYLRNCPVRDEMMAGFLDLTKDVNVIPYSGGWSAAPFECTTSSGSNPTRTFSLAYEQTSGDGLIVYRSGNQNSLRYRTFIAGTWSAESVLSPLASGTPRLVKLVPRPAADEMMLLYVDSGSDITAFVWDGAAFGNGIVLETDASGSQDDAFDAAYLSDGSCLTAWMRRTTTAPRSRIWSGTAWGNESVAPSVGATSSYLKLAADPASTQAFLVTLDSDNHVNVERWSGSAWSAAVELETGANGGTGRAVDLAFEPDGTRALLLWSSSGKKTPYYSLWDGSAWSAAAAGPTLSDPGDLVQLSPSASGREILAALRGGAHDEGWALRWDGSTLGGAQQFSAGLEGAGTDEAFMISDCPAGGLLAWWKLDGNGLDSTPNLNHSTVQNGEGDEWTTGRIGTGSVSLDGANDFLRTADRATGLQVDGSYTALLWVNLTADQAHGAGVYSKTGPSGTTDQWALKLDSTADHLEVVHDGGSPWNAGLTLAGLAGRWRFVAIAYNAATGTVKSYLEGIQASSGSLAAPAAGNGHMNIGASRNETPLKGKIDDFKVYNRALSLAEIQALYAGAGRSSAFTIQSWREKREP